MSKRIPFILGFILLTIAIWLQVTTQESIVHLISRLQNLAYDMALHTKLFAHQRQPQPSVAIIDIDDKSLAAEGRWPWPRAKMAALVDQLEKAGAVVIAFDIVFPEMEANIAAEVLTQLSKQHLAVPAIKSSLEKIKPFFNGDAKLAASLRQIDSVLGVSFLPRPEIEGVLDAPMLKLDALQAKQLGFITAPGVIGNIALLQSAAKGAGFINVFPDEDGIIRRVPVLIRYQNELYPSLALEAVQLFLLNKASLVTEKYGNKLRLEAVRLGNDLIPTDEKGQVIIPFRGKSFTFPYYSATDVLHNHIPVNALQGKILFVGTSATGLGDLKATAIQNIFPGVEIQATIADGLLAKDFSYKPAWSLGAEVFFTFILGIICIFLFPYLGPRVLSLVILLIPPILIFSNDWLWEKTGLIISLFIPMLFCVVLAITNISYGYLFETRKRERIKEMFGQYVPEQHIEEMLTSTKEYGLLGDDREMTVLFADIRNFTTISEPLAAAQLKAMLSEFFTPMTDIIFQYHGTIDKYVGDMIMAFWGAPLTDKRHIYHALNAALDMQAAVEKLKPVFAAKGWAEINIGIGLNSGIMSVGDMGSKFRRNYTVLGDAVNLASRIEGLTKYYGVKILVTEQMQRDQKHFVFRKVDRVRVKGKKTSIEIYELLGREKNLSQVLQEELQRYHQALDDYFSQRWEKARASLIELNQSYPENNLYSLYLSRIAAFEKESPGVDWDGIYTHATK